MANVKAVVLRTHSVGAIGEEVTMTDAQAAVLAAKQVVGISDTGQPDAPKQVAALIPPNADGRLKLATRVVITPASVSTTVGAAATDVTAKATLVDLTELTLGSSAGTAISGNPEVFTVAAAAGKFVITPVAEGTAVLTVKHNGAYATAEVVVAAAAG